MPPADELWSDATARLGINAQFVVGLATVLAILVTTRLTSGAAASPHGGSGKCAPPVSSHWIPWLGNGPSLALGQETFLKGLRDRFDGIFSFTIMGKMHHFLHKPTLVPAYFNLQQAGEEDRFMGDHVIMGAFGLPKGDYDLVMSLVDQSRAEYKYLSTEPGLGEMTNTALRLIRHEISHLVTFNAFPADQREWERVAGADVIEDVDGQGTQAVEVDLMELVRNFIAKTATPALFGTDFVDNFSDIFQMNWIFDEAFVPLAMGLPRWIPVPRVQRGKLARRKLHASIREFHAALDKHLDGQDPGPQWENLDNVSELVKTRVRTWRKHGLSPDARAVMDQALLWATTGNVNPLTTWMLFEVCRDAVLLEQIREEIAPYVEAVQPENEFGPAVWISPELRAVDIDGLTKNCPLIKAAYIETLRLYTSTWSMMWMKRDTVLEERCKDGRSWVVEGGSCVHVPMALHHHDANYFADPNEFKVERHIRETVDDKGVKVLTAEMGTVRPYGGGVKMCRGKAFAMREMIMYVAIIISFYDIVPVNGGPWPTPKLRMNVSAAYPSKPLRVWIKRKKIEPVA